MDKMDKEKMILELKKTALDEKKQEILQDVFSEYGMGVTFDEDGYICSVYEKGGEDENKF